VIQIPNSADEIVRTLRDWVSSLSNSLFLFTFTIGPPVNPGSHLTPVLFQLGNKSISIGLMSEYIFQLLTTPSSNTVSREKSHFLMISLTIRLASWFFGGKEY
jgi:hypothetical protein